MNTEYGPNYEFVNNFGMYNILTGSAYDRTLENNHWRLDGRR